jgi:hypothetical protein
MRSRALISQAAYPRALRVVRPPDRHEHAGARLAGT